MRNINVTPNGVLAYHKLLARFLVHLRRKINNLGPYFPMSSAPSPVCPCRDVWTISDMAGP
jgi:hypothetical protein